MIVILAAVVLDNISAVAGVDNWIYCLLINVKLKVLITWLANSAMAIEGDNLRIRVDNFN